MKKYDAVLFDLDGTTIDTLADLIETVNVVLAKNGYPQRTDDEIRGFLSNGTRRLVADAAGGNPDEEEINKLVDDYKSYYMTHCCDLSKPYAGIPELLRELRDNGIFLGIVTNKVDEIACKMAKHYFPGLFRVVVGQKDEIPHKPAPNMMECAMAHLGVDKEQCFYIGDSEVDVATAKNVGCDFIAAAWGFRDRDVLIDAGASRIVDDVAELRSLLAEIFF